MLSVKRGRMLIFTLQPVQCCLVVSPLLQFTVGFRRFKKTSASQFKNSLKYCMFQPNRIWTKSLYFKICSTDRFNLLNMMTCPGCTFDSLDE